MRGLLSTLAVVLLMTAASMAHHGYGEYDRNKHVTLEGVVKQPLWSNPHVVFKLTTPSGREYLVEWLAVSALSRRGIMTNPFKEGDVVSVTGSVNKDPGKRIITLLQEIRRPSDGWHWTSSARLSPAASE